MTLQVNKELMPVIREPNYSDKTWDMSMDKMVIVVGNEKKDQALKSIPLKEYLESFDQYMSKPPANTKLNLLRKVDNKGDKDTHVIMSSQACFLSVEASAETKFNVALYNYQSWSENPAILVILSTSKGSSAQIIEVKKKGKKADFVAERLSDSRKKRGVAVNYLKEIKKQM
ncbi:hypothetical protein RFI_31174 [Reticulomyxa filosa]|uniref:Uncharacterized protein n=1 Tax=Reticulomyxa filosa TaxID=46433 RepID=X6LYH7_RETFI|nr:hypothetical protein RFI_31174 [Reticulomyxa filosa]|eukprot:ETO06222.1 hypothetical protein RFI_31174 [Reticulomyxa filosa]